MTSSARVAGGGRPVTITREYVIEKIQRWVALYGEPPRAADWNPSSARWSGAPWRIERYEAGDPETGEPWPSLNAAKRPFGGSLNAAIKAAGFKPNRSGPPSRKRLLEPMRPDALVMSPEARVALAAARAEARELAERVEVRDRHLERSRSARDRLAGELDAARDEARRARAERKPAKPITKTKVEKRTVTRVERVPDHAAVQRAQAAKRRADEARQEAQAAANAERAIRRRVERERDKAKAKSDEAAEALRAAERERTRAVDEAAALALALERERERAVEPEVRVVRHSSDRDVEAARMAVGRAEREAHEADVRAARAERELRETVALVTGEPRQLTKAEVDELRRRGPAGPAVLARALDSLGRARRTNNRTSLHKALTEVMSAAATWRSRL